MRKIIQCVPNFSEGRRPEVIKAIVNKIENLSGVFLLGKEMDADHNRAVITLAGEPEAVKEGVFHMIKTATDLIDLTTHSGEHPRMGATDVVPFVPVENMTMAECVQLAKDLGQRVGEELHIPVYLYEEAATRPERKNLAKVRKGQFEGLREEIGVSPDRAPDYGPNHIHPTAGATAIGARFFLVAYNVNLDSQDLALAKGIARQIRESSGGFPCVKALGLELKEKPCVQVSMNLTNYTVTSIATVYTVIREEAQKAGVSVLGSEIIGFVPRDALLNTTVELLQLQDFTQNQILEHCLADVRGEETAEEPESAESASQLSAYLQELASEAPAPGGGSASALAGALAAALGRMVCHVTVGKKKYQAVAPELRAIQKHAQQIQQQLEQLMIADSQAYKAVLAAFKLPKETEEEKTRRRTAIQTALKHAASTPLQVVKYALTVLTLAETLVEKGNPNAITDAGCAVHLAIAALEGAALNIKINLNSITDEAFTQQVETELTDIQNTAKDLTHRILCVIESSITS